MNITIEQLKRCVEFATDSITVCVPSNDYYASNSAWDEDKITFVDAERFMKALEGLE